MPLQHGNSQREIHKLAKVIRIHPISCGLAYAYLVETPQGLYLVDSGSPGQHERVLAKLKSLGRADLKLIWITHAHYDHYGSSLVLRELTGAKIGVHPADSIFMQLGQTPLGSSRNHGFVFFWLLPILSRLKPLPAVLPDILLEDGETLEHFGLEATVLHTPGHTPGHTCLLLGDGTAFSGDLIGHAIGARLQFMVATDWKQLPDSLGRLQAAKPEWIYTGHSPHPIPWMTLRNLR